jgi:hypothetical protein
LTTQVQVDLRRRILRAFVGRGLIEQADAKDMLAYQHSGFSVDAGATATPESAPPKRSPAHYLWADAPDRIHYRGRSNPQDP